MNNNKILLLLSFNFFIVVRIYTMEVNRTASPCSCLGIVGAQSKREQIDTQGLSQEVVAEQFRVNSRLFSACFKKDQPELITELLDQGADIEAKDWPLGRTPLMIAAFRGHPHAVKVLLAAGAQVNARSRARDETALHEALEWNNNRDNNNPEIVAMLLAAGAHVYATDEHGRTPLLAALNYPKNDEGCNDILHLLLNAKSNLHARDKDGNTALHLAAKNRRTQALRVLIEKGLYIDAQNKAGNTPLHEATTASTIAILIRAGADTQMRNEHNRTPLQSAHDKYHNRDTPQFVKEALGLYDNIKAFITTITDQEALQPMEAVITQKIELARKYLYKTVITPRQYTLRKAAPENLPHIAQPQPGDFGSYINFKDESIIILPASVAEIREEIIANINQATKESSDIQAKQKATEKNV